MVWEFYRIMTQKSKEDMPFGACLLSHDPLDQYKNFHSHNYKKKSL